MKILDISFATGRAGDVVTLGRPPSGDLERRFRHVPGSDVVRASAGFPLDVLDAGGSIRMTLHLEARPAPSTMVWLTAAAYDSHIIGDIPETAVGPAEWRDNQCRVTVELDASQLSVRGVDQHHIAWTWSWRDQAATTARELGVSEHFLYVTISAPTAPWIGTANSSGPRTTPWLGALSLACCWARGARSKAAAAEKITEALFALGETGNGGPSIRYYPDMATYLEPGLAEPRWLNCESFLNDLAGASREPLTLNCYEAAVLVVTFANLLGCALVPVVIEADCRKTFALNRIRALGLSVKESPRAFVLHVVAGEGHGNAGLDGLLVYDPALQIDTDSAPSRGPSVFGLALAMPLGGATTPPGTGRYFPQLIAPRSRRNCHARTLDLPWVGAEPDQECVEVCPLIRYVHHLWFLQRMKPGPGGLPVDTLNLNIEGFSRRDIFTDQEGVPRTKLPRPPRASRAIFTSSAAATSHAIRVDLWTDSDRWITASFLAEVLAMCEVPVHPVDVAGITGHTVPGRTTLFVLQEGVAMQLSSVGLVRLDMVSLYAQLANRAGR